MFNKKFPKVLDCIQKGGDVIKCTEKVLSSPFFNEYVLDLSKEISDGCSLFEEAVYRGYSEETLISLLDLFYKAKMNLNQRTSMYGDTYLHTLIECDDYHGHILPFLYFGYEHGFNDEITNDSGKTIWDCLRNPETTKEFYKEDVKKCFEVKKLYDNKRRNQELKEIRKKIEALQTEEYELSKEIIDEEVVQTTLKKYLKEIGKK